LPRPTPKDYVLSLRIRADLVNEIERIAEKEKMSKSDYIRKAISDGISFSSMNRQNQTFLVYPEMLKFSLNFMEDLDIEKFAVLSLENGRQILKAYLQKNINSTIVQKYLTNKKTIITGLLTYITQSILAPTGQNWFQRIHCVWEGEDLAITGMHALGLKFSKFIRFYFIQFFEIFEYTEVATSTILKEDRLKLVFHGDFAEYDVKLLMA
jgi:hypothetical protein